MVAMYVQSLRGTITAEPLLLDVLSCNGACTHVSTFEPAVKWDWGQRLSSILSLGHCRKQVFEQDKQLSCLCSTNPKSVASRQ